MSLRIGVDIGGTFTDLLVWEDGVGAQVYKVLSTPRDPSDGLLDGIGRAAAARGLSLEDFLPNIDTIVHGTTVATNAVLTRRGAKTALLTTRGVRDALEMRRGIREEQYDNRYTNVEPLVPRHLRVGVGGRLDAQGVEVEPLDEHAVRDAAKAFEGVDAVAVCFMNSFADPSHEERAARILRDVLPGRYMSVSTHVLPAIRFYERVSTTALNAYVGPILDRYMRRLVGRLGEMGFGGVLLIMQSNGGLVTPTVAREMAVTTLLSGPAAGPRAGAAYAGDDCMVVDMGGTSFDASLVRGGSATTVTEGEIARLRVAVPMLGIHTIGAGGGSIAWIDAGGLLRVGPQSAAAEPGPACYGRGGTEPTVTDADLVLGYLDAATFAGGQLPLDRDAAQAAVARVAGPLGLGIEDAAAGIARVVDGNMAHGLRAITVRQGHDPRDFPLVVAGGAGPLHACAIARELRIPHLVVPPDSSILCAAGMLMADLEHEDCRSLVGRLDRLGPALSDAWRGMEASARARLRAEGVPAERIQVRPVLDLRYVKQYHEVRLEIHALEPGGTFDLDAVVERFHACHDALFGYSLRAERGRPAAPIEIINLRARAIGPTDRVPLAVVPEGPLPDAVSTRRAWLDGAWHTLPVYAGEALRAGNRIAGPALVERPTTTLLIAADFDAEVDPHGAIRLTARWED
jgi:N-methylhydantoinase A